MQIIPSISGLLRHASTWLAPQTTAPTTDSVALTVRANTALPAFPQVALLDDFDRADASTLGANWTTDPGGYGAQSPRIASNALSVPGDGNPAEAWWNGATFGPDLDMVVTLTEITATANDSYGLYARVSVPGDDATQGYIPALRYIGPGWQVELYRLPNYETQTATIDVVPAAGDKFGVRVAGDTFTYYIYHSGAWEQVAEFTDTDYAEAGYLGVGGFNTSGSAQRMLDNFSAATLTPQSENLIEIRDSADALPLRISADGHVVIAAHAAPADADLAAGDCALWFDQTNGAAKLTIKAKQANGTVVNGEVALT
jgi:hypothetical protein